MKNFIKEYVPYIVIIILVLLFKKYMYSPIRVNGSSMMKTLHNKDIMILDIIGAKTKGIKRFDIVVVKQNHDYLIKRVIGLPGEEIEYKDNKLYVNGKYIEENYGSAKTQDFKAKVSKNSYFVLGDNRTNSLDSRYFGCYERKRILGKTSLTIFPFKRFGNKK